jgi:hypothetical protein
MRKLQLTGLIIVLLATAGCASLVKRDDQNARSLNDARTSGVEHLKERRTADENVGEP